MSSAEEKSSLYKKTPKVKSLTALSSLLMTNTGIYGHGSKPPLRLHDCIHLL